ncbi:MAG: hypothetical protein ACFFBZ_08000 [Promethearchaeota archaeon]
MRLGKKVLSRPRCENCGARIYRTRGIFKNYFWGEIPSHCPKCGEQISLDKKNHLREHDELIWLLWCVIFITIVIVVLVIFL